MDALIEKVNAKLPTARPEPVHLALAQGQHPCSCDQCPIGEEIKSGRRCARPATDAVLAASIAPLLAPEPVVGGSGKRRPVPKPRHGGKGPTEGRMGLSVSGIPTQTSEPAAKRRVAVNHRASRQRHRTFVAFRSHRYLRPVRPMRYAYRRPQGIFAALFGW